MMLKDKPWLIPCGIFSRQKAGGHGREFPIVAAAYHVTDICKATEKMLLAGKRREITYLFNRITSKRMRQLPETHQGVAEVSLQKIEYGLGPKRESPFQS